MRALWFLITELNFFYVRINTMRNIKNFNQVQIELEKFIEVTQTGAKQYYDLSRIFPLMNFLDNPQNKLKIIHIAGTSGKTSTSYYVASLLHNAGYNVGLTVSPHVDTINERTQINMIPLPEKEYCSYLNEFLDIVDESDIKVSYFEVLVAFAYWVFAKQKVDYAVIEVGLLF